MDNVLVVIIKYVQLANKMKNNVLNFVIMIVNYVKKIKHV